MLCGAALKRDIPTGSFVREPQETSDANLMIRMAVQSHFDRISFSTANRLHYARKGPVDSPGWEQGPRAKLNARPPAPSGFWYARRMPKASREEFRPPGAGYVTETQDIPTDGIEAWKSCRGLWDPIDKMRLVPRRRSCSTVSTLP